jgi:hypothetical protein
MWGDRLGPYRNTAKLGEGGPFALPATLGRLILAAETVVGVRRGDLATGDRLLVSTKNSIYSLVAQADGRFLVSGGRFARAGAGEQVLAVNGCTAGTRALFTDLIAAPGLFLELGDGTLTTRIRSVRRLAAVSPTQPAEPS